MYRLRFGFVRIAAIPVLCGSLQAITNSFRHVLNVRFSGICGVRSAECGVRSAECGVRSVENAECGKCGV